MHMHFLISVTCDCIFQKYVAVGELGKATDTLDATGSVTLEKDFGNTASTSHLISIQQSYLFIEGIQIVFVNLQGT